MNIYSFIYPASNNLLPYTFHSASDILLNELGNEIKLPFCGPSFQIQICMQVILISLQFHYNFPQCSKLQWCINDSVKGLAQIKPKG